MSIKPKPTTIEDFQEHFNKGTYIELLNPENILELQIERGIGSDFKYYIATRGRFMYLSKLGCLTNTLRGWDDWFNSYEDAEEFLNNLKGTVKEYKISRKEISEKFGIPLEKLVIIG